MLRFGVLHLFSAQPYLPYLCCSRLRPADDPRAVTGTFAAADWMFSIAPNGGMSASAAASLRFGHAADDSSDDSEPPLRVSAPQQQRGSGLLAAQASPRRTAEHDPSSRGFSNSVAMEAPGEASEQDAAVRQGGGEDVQPAQPPRRRVSFANRLPSAARVPPTLSRADGASARDDTRATAERVAAQVTAEAPLLPCQISWSSAKLFSYTEWAVLCL